MTSFRWCPVLFGCSCQNNYGELSLLKMLRLKFLPRRNCDLVLDACCQFVNLGLGCFLCSSICNMASKRAPLSEIDPNSQPSKKAKPSTKSPATSPAVDRLKVFELSTSLLSTTVNDWLRGNAAGSGSNASLPGAIRVVSDSHLKFRPPEIDRFGACWCFYTREKRGGIIREVLKLVEGGTNSDSPRYELNGVIFYR
jgi:hypothetical protein